MTPVCERGDDQSIDVGENRFHRLAFFRRRCRELCLQFARLNLREHRQVFNVLEITRDPVDDLMTEPAEFFGRHVA